MPWPYIFLVKNPYEIGYEFAVFRLFSYKSPFTQTLTTLTLINRYFITLLQMQQGILKSHGLVIHHGL